MGAGSQPHGTEGGSLEKSTGERAAFQDGMPTHLIHIPLGARLGQAVFWALGRRPQTESTGRDSPVGHTLTGVTPATT